LGKNSGMSNRALRLKNKMTVLQMIATGQGISRIDIAQKAGMTKMTVSNIVSDLIKQHLAEEDVNNKGKETLGVGRSPVKLRISHLSPVICGISIKREMCQMILGDFAGNIIDKEVYQNCKGLSKRQFIRFIKNSFTILKARSKRPILAVGISCIGPVDSTNGIIIHPPTLEELNRLHIVDIIKKFTHLPCFLLNDGNAGALAELLYGAGRTINNFVSLYIVNGIGSGFVLGGKLYDGDSGQSGEIGHSTINFGGPKCACGNTGCLELYANIENIKKHIADLSPLYPESGLVNAEKLSIADIIDAANQQDHLAISALEEFCGYLAHATTNIINLLDLSYIIVDYNALSANSIFEYILFQKISASIRLFKPQKIQIFRSPFYGQATLVGSIAIITYKIFRNEMTI
jgi:predicted NBD/HSP70 family sugar kinase